MDKNDDMKLNPALIDGNHPAEHPEIAKAAKKADALDERLGESHAVWIRPNSTTCFVVPDNTDNRLEGCVMVYSTEDGWISIPDSDVE